MIFLSRVDVGFGDAFVVGGVALPVPAGFLPVVCGVCFVVTVCSGVVAGPGSGVGATVRSVLLEFAFAELVESVFELSDVAAKSIVGSGVGSKLGIGDASGGGVAA